MKVLVYMGHPAHFQLFKNVIRRLERDGNEVFILIKKKDVLETLLVEEGFHYINILPEGRPDTDSGRTWGAIKRIVREFRFCRKHRPDIYVGTSFENPVVGSLFHKPVINVCEDDADVYPSYWRITYPLSSAMLVPSCCDCGGRTERIVKYESYHELAYLHPDNFTPDRAVVEKYFPPDTPYFILRFVKFSADHDKGVRGISTEIALKIVGALAPYGRVVISSERELPPELEAFRLAIKPVDIHDLIAFSQIMVGDSQTMSAEAAVLGVPYIRFSDFAGRHGYLNELENRYQLGFSFKTFEESELFAALRNLLAMPDRQAVFQERRRKMLDDKMDYANYLTGFIERYEDSDRRKSD
jgi:predicted glycosyltransferase